MLKSPFVTTFLLAVLTSLALAAEDAGPIVRGTDGLMEMPFVARNEGPGMIACSAALAHWYSFDLGRAAPGGSVQAALWYDPKDGNVYLLNAMKDRMPVQALWCGFAEHAWATRTLVPIERAAAGVPAPIHLTCAPEGDRLACR